MGTRNGSLPEKKNTSDILQSLDQKLLSGKRFLAMKFYLVEILGSEI